MEKEKFQLWQIEEVQRLSDELCVVRNIVTGELMLRRTSSSESLEVMQKLSSISHPNLMKIYDTALIGERCVSLCEYIDGFTLDATVSAYGPYDEKNAKAVMNYVCAGLTALHNADYRSVTQPQSITIDF